MWVFLFSVYKNKYSKTTMSFMPFGGVFLWEFLISGYKRTPAVEIQRSICPLLGVDAFLVADRKSVV